MAGATWPGCACRTGKLIGSERWIKLEPAWIERLIRAALAGWANPCPLHGEIEMLDMVSNRLN